MTDTGGGGGAGWMRSPWTLALVVGVVSFVVRAWVLTDLLAHDPLLRSPALDDAYYVEMARGMAAGASEPWFLAPLHPWLAARLSGLAEIDVALLCWMNAVTGALTSVAIAFCARELRPGRGAWIAGGVHALTNGFVFHDVLPGQEPLLALLHVLAVLLGIRVARGAGVASAGGVGALTGVAMLGRGTSLALLLCLVPALRAANGRRRLRLLGACAAGLVLALLPAMVRNASVHGSLSPLPWSGGANLYLANGPDARATVSFSAGELGNDPWAIEARSREIAVAAEGRDLEPAEVSVWWRDRTLDELGGARELVLHLLRKAALFWSFEERGSNHSLDVEREFALWLRFHLLRTGLVILLPLALAVWWTRRREDDAWGVAAWPILGTWLLLTVFFPVARYRLPLQALGAVLLGAHFSGPGPRVRRAGLAILAAGALLAFLPIRTSDPGMAHVNVAAAHLRLEDDERVIEERLREAIDAAPESGPAREFLGRLLLSRAYGDPVGGRAAADEAFQHLVVAAQDRRTRFSAQVAALAAMVVTGRTERAPRAAQGLLREQPENPELLANAAWVAAAVGDQRTARSLLAKARRIAPDLEQVAVVARFTGL